MSIPVPLNPSDGWKKEAQKKGLHFKILMIAYYQ